MIFQQDTIITENVSENIFHEILSVIHHPILSAVARDLNSHFAAVF